MKVFDENHKVDVIFKIKFYTQEPVLLLRSPKLNTFDPGLVTDYNLQFYQQYLWNLIANYKFDFLPSYLFLSIMLQFVGNTNLI